MAKQRRAVLMGAGIALLWAMLLVWAIVAFGFLVGLIVGGWGVAIVTIAVIAADEWAHLRARTRVPAAAATPSAGASPAHAHAAA